MNDTQARKQLQEVLSHYHQKHDDYFDFIRAFLSDTNHLLRYTHNHDRDDELVIKSEFLDSLGERIKTLRL